MFRIYRIDDDKICNSVLKNFNRKFKYILNQNTKIKPKHILNFIVYLMQNIEQYNIKGDKKKELVIKLINNIVNINKENIHNKDHIDAFVKHSVPTTIDTLIMLDRKDLAIKI